jgi:hypothetical protein
MNAADTEDTCPSSGADFEIYNYNVGIVVGRPEKKIVNSQLH